MGPDTDLPDVLLSGVDRAITVQQSVVAGFVQRLRRARPDATPGEIVSALERRYLVAVTGSGAAVGGVAAVPGVGTGLALVLSVGETAVFLETTALFTLAVADVHAIRVEEVERRRMLLLAMVLGDGGSMLVEKIAGRTGQHWGRMLTELIPMSSITAINRALSQWLVTKYSRQRGVLAIGRIASFGIGAGIGAAGNHAFGRMVVSASRRAFGPAPLSFPDGPALTVVSRGDTPPPPPPLDPPPLSAPRHGPSGPGPGTGTVPSAPASPGTPSATAVPPAAAPPNGTPAGAGPSGSVPAGAPEPEPRSVPEPAAESVTPITGKYRALLDYLVAHAGGGLEITLTEIDAIVPGGLPKSAATSPAWWSNSTPSRQARAWLAAGYRVTDVDLDSRTVRFGPAESGQQDG